MTLAANDCDVMVQEICTNGRITMAERKSALNRAPARPELEKLLERARTAIVTDELLREQRASFVYGNAPFGSRITKESALQSLDRIRVTQPAEG